MSRLEDLYAELQVSPDAEPEVIERIHRVLAARYHPDNRQTGDLARYLRLNRAFQILSDPVQRQQYDNARRTRSAGPHPVFQSREFTDGIEAESNIRLGILCVLYDRRRENVNAATVTLLELEQTMQIPRDHLQFSAWYLRSKKLVLQDDRSGLAITAEGVDHLEECLPRYRTLWEAFGGGHSPRLEAALRLSAPSEAIPA